MHMTSRLRIITKLCMARKLKPTHPGEVLIEDFLKPLGLSEYFWQRISLYLQGASMK